MKQVVKHTIAILFCSLLSLSVWAQKSSVKVLYVGADPAKPPRGMADDFPSAESLNKRRSPSFKKFLKANFTKVKVVYGQNYKEEMSDDYDVTIIDAYLTKIKDREEVKDENGELLGFIPPAYLSPNYTAATLIMDEHAHFNLESLKSRFSWYCFCLDSYAHGMDLNHEIFKGVDLTLEDKEIPAEYHKDKMFKNGVQGTTMPMWRVHEGGFMEARNPPGLVSIPDGFLDSPDTEIISSGVNTKSHEAVAIARHANFLMWGFNASPDRMTDEAKEVFINAIHYIKKFKGHQIVGPRSKFHAVVRDSEIDKYYIGTTKQRYQEVVAHREARIKSEKEQKKQVQEKIAKGETLTEEDKFIKDTPVSKATPPYDQWVRRFWSKEHQNQFQSESIEACRTYMKENREYFYNDPNRLRHTDLTLDEQVKALGVSNRSIELLEKCVTLLKNGGEDAQTAREVLARYTNEEFTSAKHLEKWLKENRDYLFFSDLGGFKWFIDENSKRLKKS